MHCHSSKEYLLKRPFDCIASTIGLFFSSPLWLLLCFLIWLEEGRPIFYLQERVGKGGKTFKVVKFRSMYRDAEKDTGPILARENDPRITPIGRILRASALDELPQLINIFKGDMSFVGPRPERPEMVSGFQQSIPMYWKRHCVRPGLTGLAQIRGHYDSPAKQKLRYDLFYIKKANLLLDLYLILISFWFTFHLKWEIYRQGG